MNIYFTQDEKEPTQLDLFTTPKVESKTERANWYGVEGESDDWDDYDDCDIDSYNFMDDAEALASAGFGTDEDYGGYNY